MSTPNSGLFVGADGKVYDATDGMSDTGLTADITQYAYNSGLFLNKDGEVVDITALLRPGSGSTQHQTIRMEVEYEDDTTETFLIPVEGGDS